jgi:hypothetical protein
VIFSYFSRNEYDPPIVPPNGGTVHRKEAGGNLEGNLDRTIQLSRYKRKCSKEENITSPHGYYSTIVLNYNLWFPIIFMGITNPSAFALT